MEMVLIDLLINTRLTQTFNLFKKKKKAAVVYVKFSKVEHNMMTNPCTCAYSS